MIKAMALFMLLSYQAIALTPADKAIDDCIKLTQAEEHEIMVLKGQVKELTAKVEAQSSPLPFWVWLGVGALSGLVISHTVH